MCFVIEYGGTPYGEIDIKRDDVETKWPAVIIQTFK